MINIKSQETENKNKIENKILLLESPENQRAKNIMDKMCPNNLNVALIENFQKEKIKNQIISTAKSKYGKNIKVFRESDIIKECIKFNLRFINSKSFKGDIDINEIKKVDKFISENKLMVSEDEYRTNIYFLGKAINRSIESYTFNHDESTYSDNHKGYIDSNSEIIMFLQVKEFGETFYIMLNEKQVFNNLKNRISGYLHYSRWNSRLYFGIFFYLLLSLLIYFSDNPFNINNNILFYIGILIPSTILSLLVNRLFWDSNADDDTREKYSNINFFREKAVTPFKRYESIFLIGFSIFLFFLSDNIIKNIWLQNKGNTYINYSDESGVYANDIDKLIKDSIIDKKIVYNSNIKYTHKVDHIKTFSPGLIFYNSNDTIIKESLILEDKK